MEAQAALTRSDAVLTHQRDGSPTTGGHRAHAVPLPRTPLLAHALPRIDWSDAYAVLIAPGARHADASEWAGAVFHGPPPWVRTLFTLRELLIRAVGIPRSDGHAFDIVSRRSDEVLLGIDQDHLAFRASVLVEQERVVVSTIVELRNRRGAAYVTVVRAVHPFVVRAMLTRAARALAVRA
jgi:hypothetical protein